MNAILLFLLLLHRLRFSDQLLDNDYCGTAVTRNRSRSLITLLVKHVLRALPSGQPFSLQNLIAG